MKDREQHNSNQARLFDAHAIQRLTDVPKMVVPVSLHNLSSFALYIALKLHGIPIAETEENCRSCTWFGC